MGSYSEKQIEEMLAPGPVLYPGRIKSKSLTNYTGTDIHYIGDRCFAFSGAFAQQNTTQTLFDFTTKNSFIVATLTMTAPIRMTAGGIIAGVVRGYQLDFNSQTVGLYKADSGAEDMPSDTEVQILIPPFTAVALSCIDDNTNATYSGTANITGTVHAPTTTDTGGL